MNILEILSFSFCSKKTKNLVTSLKLTAEKVTVFIGHQIKIALESYEQWCVFDFYEETDVAETDDFIPFPVPDAAVVRCKESESNTHLKLNWRRPEYEMRDWVVHFLSVLHHLQIDEISFQADCDRFNVHSIAEALRGYPIVALVTLRTVGKASIAARKALEMFNNTLDLYIMTNPFEEPCSIQKVLVRNYEDIFVDLRITFEDLLTINSSVIYNYVCDWTEQVINRFLKLWIRGSNPWLEHLKIHCQTKDEAAVLKNIKYKNIARNVEREFRPTRTSSDEHLRTVRGGFDIKRRDGTVATISVRNFGELCHFDMFVWFK